MAGAASLLLFAATLFSDLMTSIPLHPLEWLLWVCAISFVALPAAFLAGLLRARWARAGVADLIVELRAARGAALQPALARALGDPTLSVGGWLPEFGAYVDSEGQAVLEPVDGSGRTRTLIEHNGRRLALLLDQGPTRGAGYRWAARSPVAHLAVGGDLPQPAARAGRTRRLLPRVRGAHQRRQARPRDLR